MSDKEIMRFTDSEFQSKPYFKVTSLPVNLGGESFFLRNKALFGQITFFVFAFVLSRPL